MSIIISLLRGINVGGNKKIKMADLRDLYTALGFKTVKTLLQSGNAVFETDITELPQIKQTIEDGIQATFGFDVQIILRTPTELKTIVANAPFTDEQLNDPAKISIVYMDVIPEDEAVDDLRDSNTGNEEIYAKGHELYIFYANGKGKSKLNNTRIERKLKVTATARNWNTTNKILKLVGGFEM
jgi:uncharacterized protein (DUF1697 family)